MQLVLVVQLLLNRDFVDVKGRIRWQEATPPPLFVHAVPERIPLLIGLLRLFLCKRPNDFGQITRAGLGWRFDRGVC